MYKEINENGQYQLDCRLSSERNLEENTNVMVSFACDILKEEVGDKRVRNRHEGYGFLAEHHVSVTRAVKSVKDGMTDLLNTLAMDDAASVDKIESLANALSDTIVAAVRMAAEARRISVDLFKESWNPTTGDDEGFEDPEAE